MSSIAGIVHLDGAPVDPKDLTAMLQSLASNKPPGCGHRSFGWVGLAHDSPTTTRGSVGEQQPIGDAEAGCWLVADVRIDNRQELIRAVQQSGVSLRWGTDAELILRAYQIWGEATPEKLLGDFAFAIWDSSRQRLFCARDPLGVKPFYYYLDGRRFLFASAIRGLFGYPNLPRRLNEVMAGLYLADDYSDKKQTLYLDLFRLPLGSRLSLEGHHFRQERYWDVRFDKPIRYPREEDYSQHFRELFFKAVECRLCSSQPVGAFLSGGLDSSSVVSAAQHIYAKNGNGKALETFSGYFLTPLCDERNAIGEVTRCWPVHAHTYRLDDVSPSTYAEEMIEQFHGIHDPTLFSFRALAEKAREKAVRVILTGIGGDEFHTGIPFVFADLLRQGRLHETYSQINLFAETLLFNRRTLWLRYALFPLLPEQMKNAYRQLRRHVRRQYPPWITPEFAHRIGLPERLATRQPNPPHTSHVQGHLYQVLEGGYWTFVMEQMQALGGTQQIEFRFPMADARLVDFVMRIPGEQLLQGDTTKRLLRLALKGILPDGIRLQKRKTEFDPVIEYEFRERPFVRGFLESLELARDGFVVSPEVKKFYSRVVRGGTKQAMALYSILAVELWYRRQKTRLPGWGGGA